MSRARRLLLLLLVAALGVTMTACANSATTASSPAGKHTRDRDNDSDENDDDAHILDYGRPASGATREQLVTLLTDYYEDAAKADGAKACALLVPYVAELAGEESGPSDPHGKTCAAVLSKWFSEHHAQYQAQRATLKFVAIRVGEERALDVMSFANLPEVRQISARDYHGRWQLLNALDRIIE